jgi:hypothetical protein
MQQELERTRQSYDEVIGTTRKALEDSQAAQASQASLMSGLTEKQEQASRIQSAEAEKSTIMARDAMSNTKRTVDAAKQQVSSRRRRRGLMSTMSTMNR